MGSAAAHSRLTATGERLTLTSQMEALRETCAAEQAARTDLATLLRLEADRVAAGVCPRPSIDYLTARPLLSRVPLSLSEIDRLASAADLCDRLHQCVARVDDPAGDVVLEALQVAADALGAGDLAAVREAEEIVDPKSAQQLLWRLISEPEMLSDSEWSHAIDGVGAKLGQPVRVAIMRGRFAQLTSQPSVDASQQHSTPAASPAEAVDHKVGDHITDTGSALERSDFTTAEEGLGGEQGRNASTADGEATKPPEDEIDRDNVLLDVDDDIDQPTGKRLAFGRNELGDDGVATTADDWLKHVASDVAEHQIVDAVEAFRWATDEVGDSEVNLTGRLVDYWQFLERGEPSLASRFAEQSGEPNAARICRLWALAQHVTFANGSLALAAQREIAGLSTKGLSRAEHLLLQAALTRVAIVAPGTRAGVVLRSLPRSEHDAAIEQTCLRVAAAGERLGGINEVEFRTVIAADVRDELQLWVDDVRERVHYSTDRPIYLRTHWSLVRPDRMATTPAVERWRAQRAVEQFLVQVAVPLLEGGADRLRDVREEVDHAEQLVTTNQLGTDEQGLLARGLACVRRFAHASATRSGQSALPSPEVDHLRSELISRRRAVDAAFQTTLQESADDAARVATMLFRDTMEDLQKLLHAHTVVPLDEPAESDVFRLEPLKLVPALGLADSDRAAAFSGYLSVELLERYAAGSVYPWSKLRDSLLESGETTRARRVERTHRLTTARRAEYAQQQSSASVASRPIDRAETHSESRVNEEASLNSRNKATPRPTNSEFAVMDDEPTDSVFDD